MLQETRDGDVSVVHPVGEIDMQTMRPLRELVQSLPDDGVRYMVLDLRDVSFLDSAGMSVLFGAKKRLSEDGGECYVVTSEKGFVAKTLDTIAIDKVMPHMHELDEAMLDIQEQKAGHRESRRAGACFEEFAPEEAVDTVGASELEEAGQIELIEQAEAEEVEWSRPG
jgi:anti-anti-sigma factor